MIDRAEENRAQRERAERIRNQEFPSPDGWLNGIRLESVFNVRPSKYGIEVSCGWGGAIKEITIHVPYTATHDPEGDEARYLAAREELARKLMGG
ncbi:MAG: hypothetical protein ACU843_16980 [Gammaproteobacteria bacterium]